MSSIVPIEKIENKIFLIRGKKVMFDRDLAELYGVETRRLNEQVKRNVKRFPSDFMFQLTTEELENWMSQIAISNKEKMGIRKMPYVFTEHGVLMLSSVINSEIAIQVNIQIMRAFTKLREMIATHKDLLKKVEDMEKKYDENFAVVFETLKQLIIQEEQPKKKIGFHIEKD